MMVKLSVAEEIDYETIKVIENYQPKAQNLDI